MTIEKFDRRLAEIVGPSEAYTEARLDEYFRQFALEENKAFVHELVSVLESEFGHLTFVTMKNLK